MVYVRINVDSQVGGLNSATVVDNDDLTNQITFTVYDDGTFPDNNPNDGYYWGKFTIEDGYGAGTDDINDVLELLNGETATITCDLDGVADTGIATITAAFSPGDYPPSIGNVEVAPNPFSPNGDGVQDEVTISYSLSDNLSTSLYVRVEVRDTNSKIIKTLADAEIQDTGKIFTYSWNGTYDNRTPASDGNYILRIIALDEDGNSTQSTLGINIDTVPPQIANVSLSPNPFSPNLDSVKDTTTISFTLTDAATGGNWIEVRSSTGELVKTLNEEISPTPGGQNGENTLIWDGRDESGDLVTDGSYYYEIWAQDDAGNMDHFTGKVYVDTTPPTTALQVLDNSKTHISPFDASDLGMFSPTGLYISDVNIDDSWQTYDPSGIYEVKVIIDENSFVPQNPNGNWQGWYLYWTPPASSGVYTIFVMAKDNAGNDTGASGASTTIIYDNSPPSSEIAYPPDGIKFNTSTLKVSGTATDGEGVGVREVEVQVINLSSSTVVVSFDTSSVVDTSLEGDWSTWEYVFFPPDPGSPPVDYLIQCRAVDNLFDPLSSTSSSHIQATSYSVVVTYDTKNLPSHPTNLKDDGTYISSGHIFGINNRLSATQAYFSGLKEVRFEYKVEPEGGWQIIGSSPYTATPPASYTAEVVWDTKALSPDFTYSFRAVAVSGDTGEVTVSSPVFDECKIDNVSPSAPYELKDDGDLVTSGHIFGKINLLSCFAESDDSSLEGVRFEYRDYTASATWTSIGIDTSPEGDKFSILWDTSFLDPAHTYWIKATAVDVAGNETSSSVFTDCSIDSSAPVFQSLILNRETYQNGDTIIITANLDASGYTLSCDFSSIDSEYGQGNNVESVEDNLDSTYKITYTIHSLNTRSDSTYTVYVFAEDEAGNQASSSVNLILNNDTSSGPDSVGKVEKVSLDYEGESLYDIKDSTEATSPVVFVNRKIDTVYLKTSLNQDIDTQSTTISLLKVRKIYTNRVEGDLVEGDSSVEWNREEGWVKLYFYLDSPFDPDTEDHTRDGLYWAKANIKYTSGEEDEFSFFFVYDTTPPQSPEFKLESFNSTTGFITLSGTTYPDISDPQIVKIFVNGVSKATVEAESDGNFSAEIWLSSGKNFIKLISEDKAGNESSFTSPFHLTYNPQKLFSIIFYSSRVLRSSSATSPVELIYYLSEPAEVIIKVYNLLGDVVYSWQDYVIPGSEKKWCWWGKNMFGEDVNNGVYILMATAKSTSGRKDTITKLVGVLR